MRFLIIILFIALPWFSLGQEQKILQQDQLLWFVENFHPISKQGKLLLNKGEGYVRKARGAFDPYLHSDFSQKQFEGKEYYGILNGGLKVPTWYGVELKTGFEQNDGLFLNPENTVPANGLWYAGISVPLAQGFLLDNRRASLKQAQLFAESTEAEQRKLLNDLYFDAIQHYWKWVETWNRYQVYEESLLLAKVRFEGVRQSFFQGDKPAIDTLEAFIQVQNRQMSLRQFEILYQKSSLDLSNFLWFEKNTPLEITDSLRPPTFQEINLANFRTNFVLQDLLVQVSEQHPELQLYEYKLASMDVEKRLKVEGLKPKININYNALNTPVGTDVTRDYSLQNYKWGVEFSFPLFLRKQRGDLQLTKLKIQDTELGQQQKTLELQNKVRSYYREHLNLQGQIELFNNALGNYSKMLSAERQLFNTGESSLFLINSRENSLINAQLKLVELIAKYNVAQQGVVWATGSLYKN